MSVDVFYDISMEIWEKLIFLADCQNVIKRVLSSQLKNNFDTNAKYYENFTKKIF